VKGICRNTETLSKDQIYESWALKKDKRYRKHNTKIAAENFSNPKKEMSI
jgi:uncharacterized membrane protein YjgN (DUF898 family)